MSKTLKLADYLGKPFDCSCGRTHSTTLEGVTVSAGAMKALPEYVEKYGFKNLYIACDEITYGIAGEKVMNILKDAGIKAKAHVFKGKRFIPDEKALGELMIDADRDCDLVVATICAVSSASRWEFLMQSLQQQHRWMDLLLQEQL